MAGKKVVHVWVTPGDGEPEVGHIVRSTYTNEAGEEKADVYTASSGVVACAYRDPSDFDDQGSGGCYWNIVTSVEGSNRA